MILVKDKADCCGCRACEQVCPKSAIMMKEDECGFLYPEIDEKKCIDCGLCLKKCAFQSGYKKRKEFEPFYGYAARHKDDEILMKSQSGGASIAISDVILENGGVVFGVGFYEKKESFKLFKKDKEDNRCFSKVVHKRADTKEERDEFCGSKYVQSDTGDVFLQIKNLLDEGRQVLFSGTGCQVGALHMFLGKEYDNLVTVDLICHGVPTPKLWRDFVDMREREKGSRVTDAKFRDKVKFGWKSQRETVWIDGQDFSTRLYAKIFYMDTALRQSCFNCIYTNKNRPGDLTVADFWGHEDAVPDFYDDNRGISLVLVNTSRGKEIWEKASESMHIIDCTGYPFRHINMKRPTKKPENYEEFWKEYLENGFDYLMDKYCNYKVVTYEQVMQIKKEKELRKKEREKKKEKRQKEREKKRKKNKRKKKIKKFKRKVKNKLKNIKQRVKNIIKKILGITRG